MIKRSSFCPLCLSASFLTMVPSKAVRTYPHIDGFISQSDVFGLIRLHAPCKPHMARCPPCSVAFAVISRFCARASPTLPKTPDLQTGLRKRRCALSLLVPQALTGRGRCWRWAAPTASTFLSRMARMRAILYEKDDVCEALDSQTRAIYFSEKAGLLGAAAPDRSARHVAI